MWLRSLVDVVKSSVSRTRWYVWSWRMQLSELLTRGLSRIQKWPQMFSDWQTLWETGGWEEIQTQKTKNTCLHLSFLCPNLEKPGQLHELPKHDGFPQKKNRMDLFIISRHLNLICWVSHEENRSLIFMWDLQLLLTFDHQKWHRVTTVKNLKSV